VPFVDAQTRCLIVKDFRIFRREPLQWVQVLIFVLLMVLYFSIMGNFYRGDIGRPFQNGVSLLNLMVTGLLMCAFTGRFIYPLLSLEGRVFWLLGLLPLKRERLMWGKFVYSATGMLLPSLFLIVVSDLLLGLSAMAVILHGVTMILLALSLSGLSVGLGAAMPNFKESDPSKIAVGFGGTVNVMLGLVLLVLIVGLMVGPYHLLAATQTEGAFQEPWTVWWLHVAAALGVTVALTALVIPMRVGIRCLERMEF
jgi:ABC-2 type transport system permease protein